MVQPTQSTARGDPQANSGIHNHKSLTPLPGCPTCQICQHNNLLNSMQSKSGASFTFTASLKLNANHSFTLKQAEPMISQSMHFSGISGPGVYAKHAHSAYSSAIKQAFISTWFLSWPVHHSSIFFECLSGDLCFSSSTMPPVSRKMQFAESKRD